MPTDDTLIPDPVLDNRQERDRIARRIHRSIGNLTIEDAELGIAYFEDLKALIEENGPEAEPLLWELSSARPYEAHVSFLTQTERAFSETLYRFNQIPNKVRIALLRLLGVTLTPALPATCSLQFTKTDDYLNIEVTIPAGVEVTSEDRSVRVAIDEDLIIAAGVSSATVQATCVDLGDTRLPVNTLGLLLQSVAGISAVTNTTKLIGGADAETVDQGKIRAREEMRIGEHLGSAQDFVDYLYFNILRRKGRVTAFESYLSDFSMASLGHLLLIVQGADGLAPNQTLLNSVSAVISQRHVGGIYVTARGPLFKSFDLLIDVMIARGQSATTLINKAKSNLSAFFHPLRFEYGPEFPARYISLSDIVGQVEAASPSLISVGTSQNRFAVKIIIDGTEYQQDIPLTLGELPLLGTVTMNLLN